MNVRAKFDGGKQINRSQSGSWQARCAGAGLRINEGPAWGPAAWEKVLSTPSATFTKVAQSKSKKVEKDLKRKSTDEVRHQRKRAKRVSQAESKRGRQDYSRHDGGTEVNDVVTDIAPDQLYALMKEYYLANVKVSVEKCEELKLRTTGQGKCDNSLQVWSAERRKRVTASNVAKIAKRRPTTKVSSMVKQLLYTKFEGNTATRWGILQEESTNIKYLAEKQKSSPEITTTQSGLVISKENPWLAASPDGLVTDPAENPPQGIVEFKNPYSVRDNTIQEATSSKKGFCLKLDDTTGEISLKTNHEYYYQVQCTMYCTQRQWCDIVIRAKDIYIERVYFQKEFWIKVLPKLKEFYFTAILPELASPLGSKAIREPTDTFKATWREAFTPL